MGYILDAIIKKVMMEGPVTIDSTEYSTVVDMSGVENSFGIQLHYDNGVGLDADLSLEISVDNQAYIEIPESVVTVTDVDGSHIWDLGELGSNYIRVKIVVNSGSMDITRINFSGKRRH